MSDDPPRLVAGSGNPITEADLHAYADDRLPGERRAEVAGFLAQQPQARQRVQAWQRQNLGLRQLLAPVLDEPLPLRLPLAPARHAGWRWRALAAGMALVALGAGSGWFARGAADAGAVSAAGALASSDGASFARRAAVAHVVYAADPRRSVEIGGDQEQLLVNWLTRRLGGQVKAPSLTSLGYELVGGRLLPGGQGPVALFVYQTSAGQRLTLYVSREMTGRPAAFSFAQDGPVRVFYWLEGSFGYALSGETDRDTLQRVADEIYQQLSQG
jgi:anti-sigma factor RsiW